MDLKLFFSVMLAKLFSRIVCPLLIS